jgi:hypothetical protein
MQHDDGDVPWVYRETADGKTVKAARKATGLEPNPSDLLVKAIDTQESESHLGFKVYFENQVVKNPSCPHTRRDMVVPRQAFEEHIGKSAMVYQSIDYNAEEQEHYEHVA